MKKGFVKALKIIIAVAIIGLVGYIMGNHLGLIDSLDFGAGAYYYADMPGFAKLVNGEHYISKTPMTVLILLFLIWGYLMYRLWVWLEKKL
ncbi:MAG: hypothetical protein ACI4HQ_13060 [Acetatifactor sp.]